MAEIVFRTPGIVACLLVIAAFIHPDAADASGKQRHPAGDSSLVSNLRAEFRNGQVFLIWEEAENNDHDLRVYISDKPITSANLSAARLLTDRLEPHSANDWYDDPAECPHTAGPVHGWIIEAGREPLNRRGGLFVHTVLPSDPRLAYFAILGQQEKETMIRPGMNSLRRPASIRTEPIQAIWQLSGTQPSAQGLPLAISLHSHQGRPGPGLTQLFFGDSSMGWREGLPFKFKVSIHPELVLLEPYDRVWIDRKMSADEAILNNGFYDTRFRNIESWWYGTNNKIYDSARMATGMPVNYTERWLLWAMSWVQQAYGTDPERVYAFGASMGTGVLRLVLRNPERFASVDLMVPILDPFGEGNVGNRMKSRIGNPETICSDGVSLHDRFNTLAAIKNAQTDLPPITMRVGRTDQSVYWTLKPAFMKTVQEKKQALLAGWDNGTHSTAMRKSYEGFPRWYDFNWYIDHYALNKSYPVFTGSSLDDDPGNGQQDIGDTAGFINRCFDWKVKQDTRNSYEIWLTAKKNGLGYPVQVNITPRRLQQFRNNGGQPLYAYNIDATGKIIEKKQLQATGGLITYDRFAITSPEGNTLIISVKKQE